MHATIKNYLKILQLEIEDLRADIHLLIETAEKKKQRGEITNYVFLENMALFRNELLGLKIFEKLLEEVQTHDYQHLDSLMEFLKTSFREKTRRCGIARAICIAIDRKMLKVAKYVTE
jgi:hypothetical protein